MNHRIIGTLGQVDGTGVVRMEERFGTDIEDLWSAVTEAERLSRWLGEVNGDLRLGGAFRARFFSSGWEGTGRIDVCERPHRLLVTTHDEESSETHTIEVTLTPDGDGTLLVLEERGMSVEMLPGYGAGIQTHVEDLASYLAGGGRCDPGKRFEELFPLYGALVGS